MFVLFFFFLNDKATTEIYTYGHTLSLPDALPISAPHATALPPCAPGARRPTGGPACAWRRRGRQACPILRPAGSRWCRQPARARLAIVAPRPTGGRVRSEEHTSELQSLMRISYAVFCLKKKK